MVRGPRTLSANKGHSGPERLELTGFDYLGVLVHDRVEHPGSVHPHAICQVVEVSDHLRLETNAGVVAVGVLLVGHIVWRVRVGRGSRRWAPLCQIVTRPDTVNARHLWITRGFIAD